MSMLAERRRKTKWVINPTKKPLWTTDSNGIKYGKELMEKMGWSAGKGLGAKEQGIQEPLKVSYKNDTKGMGFKGNDDDWIEQQDEFNVLLNQLRGNDESSGVKICEEEKNEIKSLEEKSKKSRARVHYQKFTRGKDLSRYSENDLACILGTNKTKKEKPKIEEVAEKEVKSDGHLETSFGVTTINSGSIQDYFKKKWVIDKKSKTLPDSGETEYCDARPCFSMGGEETLKLEGKEMSEMKENELENGVAETEGTCEKYKKKRKKKDVLSEEGEPQKKKKRYSNEELIDCLPVASEKEFENLGNENSCDSLKKRKKEKNQSKMNEEFAKSTNGEVCTFQNEFLAEDCLSVVDSIAGKQKKSEMEKSVENGDAQTTVSSLEEVESVRKKKKKVKKEKIFEDLKKENIEGSVGLEMNGIGEGENCGGDKTKKKKKKHKDVCAEANLKVDNLGEINETHDDNIVQTKRKKKEKLNENMEGNLGEYSDSQKDVSIDFLPDSGTTEASKKKKKKEKYEKEGEQNVGNGISIENPTDTIDNKEGKKKKKKEKQERNNEIKESDQSGILSGSVSDFNSNKEEGGKKKKKEKQNKSEGMVNNNQNGILSDIPLEKTVGCEEVEHGKKKKKMEKKRQENLEELLNQNGFSEEPDSQKEDSRKKKKKEKQEEFKDINSSQNGLSNDISADYCNELGDSKKKKKKKHKTEEQENLATHESLLEKTCKEAVNIPSEAQTYQKKKKKKDKKEKQETKEAEQEESSGLESTNKKKERKSSKCEENGEKDESKIEKTVTESVNKANGTKAAGNAEIGVTGVDKVEMISQRAAYEYIPGQHTYDRVKKMYECINLARFRGSNLEILDGYGHNTKFERTVR